MVDRPLPPFPSVTRTAVRHAIAADEEAEQQRRLTDPERFAIAGSSATTGGAPGWPVPLCPVIDDVAPFDEAEFDRVRRLLADDDDLGAPCGLGVAAGYAIATAGWVAAALVGWAIGTALARRSRR